MTSRRKKELKAIGRRRVLKVAALSAAFFIGAPYPVLACCGWLCRHDLTGLGGLVFFVTFGVWALSFFLTFGLISDGIQCPASYAKKEKDDADLDLFEKGFLCAVRTSADTTHEPRERR